MLIKTQGVIIARRDFSEGDRLFWILTENYGLIQGLAKGVRKILARLSGYLELGNQVQLQLYKGKTFYTITEAQILDSFSYLKADLKKTSLIYHFFELVKIFLPLEQKQGRVYQLLLSCLKTLGQQSEQLVKVFFELKLVSELGFGPELFDCVVCGERLSPKDNFFSFSGGGALCGQCSMRDKMSTRVSDKAIKLLRWLSVEEIKALPNLVKIDQILIQEVGYILDRYLEFLSERKLHGLEFMEKIKGLKG